MSLQSSWSTELLRVDLGVMKLFSTAEIGDEHKQVESCNFFPQLKLEMNTNKLKVVKEETPVSSQRHWQHSIKVGLQ